MGRSSGGDRRGATVPSATASSPRLGPRGRDGRENSVFVSLSGRRRWRSVSASVGRRETPIREMIGEVIMAASRRPARRNYIGSFDEEIRSRPGGPATGARSVVSPCRVRDYHTSSWCNGITRQSHCLDAYQASLRSLLPVAVGGVCLHFQWFSRALCKIMRKPSEAQVLFTQVKTCNYARLFSCSPTRRTAIYRTDKIHKMSPRRLHSVNNIFRGFAAETRSLVQTCQYN